MKFEWREPITNLIAELEKKATEWCRSKNCGICFDEDSGCYELEEIRNCKKLPKLYKIYWEAKTKNIASIIPLIIKKEE